MDHLNFAAALCLFSLFLLGAVGGRAPAVCNDVTDPLSSADIGSVPSHND